VTIEPWLATARNSEQSAPERPEPRPLRPHQRKHSAASETPTGGPGAAEHPSNRDRSADWNAGSRIRATGHNGPETVVMVAPGAREDYFPGVRQPIL